MGCDYYIITYISIYNGDDLVHQVEWSRERGYFLNYDSDEEISIYKKDDKVLYENGKWLTEKIANKYSKITKDFTFTSVVKSESIN
jgi:hypothetical protein